MSKILRFDTPPGKPVLRGQEHFWRVMQELDANGPWSIRDVMKRCKGVDSPTISDFANRLVRATPPIAEKAGTILTRAGRPAATYRLLRKPFRCPRLRRDGSEATGGSGQMQMWNVMRGPLGRDGFTVGDVSLWGSTDTVPVAAETAKKYVQHLFEAGYLLRVRVGGPGKPAVYRLKPGMDTGPKPPLVLTAKVVFDQNREEAMGPVDAEEARP